VSLFLGVLRFANQQTAERVSVLMLEFRRTLQSALTQMMWQSAAVISEAINPHQTTSSLSSSSSSSSSFSLPQAPSASSYQPPSGPLALDSNVTRIISTAGLTVATFFAEFNLPAKLLPHHLLQVTQLYRTLRPMLSTTNKSEWAVVDQNHQKLTETAALMSSFLDHPLVTYSCRIHHQCVLCFAKLI
jgi:hypothetical protein